VTDPTIDSQIVNSEEQRRQRVLQHHDPKFAAQAIKKAHEIGWKPLHFLNNVSSSLAPCSSRRPRGLEGPRSPRST
jgi:branched-chain amino acid transport system substrate-binding protein